MGCGASNSGVGSFVNMCKSEGRVVSLCKERKDLIRAARDCRYALSASHVLYLQALLDFSQALDVFLKEVVVVSVDSPSCGSVSDSPLHSDEGSHLELSSVDSDSVFFGSLTDEVHREEKYGRSKISSPKASVDSQENESQISKRGNVSHMARSPAKAVTEVLEPAQEFPASVDVEYMQPIYHHPDGYAQNNYWFPVDGTGTSSGGTTNTHYYSRYNFSDHGEGSAFSVPANSSVHGQSVGEYGSGRPMGYFRDMSQDQLPYVRPNPNPIPSPPMANSTMDYFNLFSFTDDIYSSYYSRNMFEDGLGSDYPGLNYVREEEGIPPLEEIVDDAPSEPFNASKAVQDTQLDANHGTSEAHPVESDEGHMAGGDECNQSGQGEEIYSLCTSVETDDNVASTSFLTDRGEEEGGTKDVGSSHGDGKIINEGELSSQLKQAIISRRPVIDIFEVVQETNHSFLTAYNSGKEVTEILEAEKIPYLPMDSVLKGFYHRILGAIAPSTVSLQTTYMLRKQSARKILKKVGRGSGHMVKDNSHGVGLISTLDKLYMWEKKLYREVKIEENLQVMYDKLHKRSKMLVNKGAESDQIDAVQMKIKRLLPKIDVSLSAVSAISRRIKEARDEELHPQISELIHGLSKMWKSMSRCHQTQVQAVVDAKEKTVLQLHLDMKHTEDLKLKVMRWRSCLCDLLNTQRALAAFLVEWLSKSLQEEAEETGPSSPCHGWLHALETTSISGASDALEEFTWSLRNLWAKQKEEQSVRLRMELLEGWINANVSLAEAGNAEELNNCRNNLEELKALHAEVFDQAQSVASSCLKDGLGKIFAALASMCTDMLNAYDQII